MPQAPAHLDPPQTFVVDIGGTYVKSAIVDAQGAFLDGWVRERTPSPATPEAMSGLLDRFAARGAFARMSVGFPGVVRAGVVVTAPNLGTDAWAGVRLQEKLARRFQVPVRIVNDAAMQGLGLVEGPGLECVLTLGTGLGCALFRDRKLLLHLELGQFDSGGGQSFDHYVGQIALEAVGREVWSERVRRAVERTIALTCCDRLYLGGGNAAHVTSQMPSCVIVKPTKHGLSGGVRLWECDIDDLQSPKDDAGASPGVG